MAQLILALLGPFQARLDDEPIIDFQVQAARALLAYLAMHPGDHFHRQFLAGMFWPDDAEAAARTNLRQTLYRLRKALAVDEKSPPFLLTTHGSIGFNQASDFQMDVADFTSLLSANSTHAHQELNACPACIARLERALDLYRGDFLDGLPLPPSATFQEWQIITRERLHAQAMQGLETLAAHSTQRQDYPRAIQLLKRLLTSEPWREEAVRQLIRLLALDGQPAAALAQYDSYRSLLAAELKNEPEAETEELVALIRADLMHPLDGASAIEAENPYKGLHAFGLDDADNFYGRERFIERLCSNLDRLPVTVILGSSGSGKSSVVHAGVATLVNGETGAAPWRVVSMRPGAKPFAALAAQITVALQPGLAGDVETRGAGPTKLGVALAEGQADLAALLDHAPTAAQAAEEAPAAVLLIVDQFEELYSLCDDRVTQRRFIDTLLAAARSPHPVDVDVDVDSNGNGNGLPTAAPTPIKLLIALRADFSSQALDYSPFTNAIERGGLILGPMSPPDLRQAIIEPARNRGVSFEPGLVERLLTDAGHEPGNLPLLQFTLSELWQRQTQRQMTHAAYDAGGGLTGALQSHAEAVFAGFDAPAQEAIRHICSRLVHPVENAGATRRVAVQSEFSAVDWRIVQRLADARLVVTTQDKEGRETVEIAHEALIRHWPRLRAWTETDQEFGLWLRRLRSALRQWQRKGKDERALLVGVALDEAIFWLHAQGSYLNEAETAFIDASIAQRDRELIAREDAHQAALAQAEELAAAEQARAVVATRARTRLARLATALAILTLLLIAAGLFANQQRNVALRAADVMQSLNLSTSARFALSQNNTDLALALALVAMDMEDPPPQARLTLADTAYTPGAQRVFTGHEGPVNAITTLPDGQRALSAAADGTLILWDIEAKPNTRATNGEIIHLLEGHDAPVLDVALVGDGARAISAATDGALILWDLANGQPLQTSTIHPGGACCVEVLPDARAAISGGADGTVAVWELESDTVQQRLDAPGGAVVALAVSPDGSTLLTAQADHSLALYDIMANGEIREPRHIIPGHPSVVEAYTDAGVFIPGHYGAIRAVDFTPDGQSFLSAAEDQLLLVGDVANGELRAHHDLDIALHSMVAETESQALVGTLDNRVRRLDMESGKTSLQLHGHASRVEALALTPDRDHLLSGAADGSLRLWHLQNGAEIRRVDEDTWGYASLAISPDGDRMLAGLWNGQLQLIDVETGSRRCTLAGHEGMIFGGIRFLPNGRRAISVDGDMLNFSPTATVRLWDLETCRQLAVLDGARLPAWDLDLSRDGRYALYGAHDGVHLWDLETGEAKLLLDITPQNARSVVFGPDDASVLVGPGKGLSQTPDYSLIEISREHGEVLRRLPGHTEAVADLALSPDGEQLLSGSLSGELLLWDLATGEIVRALSGHESGVMAATFSPNGQLAASSDLSGQIILWDVARGNALRTLHGHTRQVLDLAFHPDGQRLFSAADDDTVREWRVDTDDDALLTWIDENRHVVELTCEERVRYNAPPLCDDKSVAASR